MAGLINGDKWGEGGLEGEEKDKKDEEGKKEKDEKRLKSMIEEPDTKWRMR